MKNKYLVNIIVFMAAAALFSCSNTRYLEPGQELYTGARVKIISEEDLPNEGALKNELEQVLRPDPNASIFGVIRPGLTLYNWIGEPKKEKGLRHWMREKLGEPPVLMKDVSPSSNVRLLINRLENNGYFDPEVSYEINEKNKRAFIDYKVELNMPYLIKNVRFPAGERELERRIRMISEESLLVPGEPFNLEVFVQERERIDEYLKNHGFFFFNPDFIIFRVDSSAGTREVDISAEIKRDMPAKARKIHIFRNIYVNTNFSLDATDETAHLSDTIITDGLIIMTKTHELVPSVLRRTIFLRSGDRYIRRNHEITLSHLMGLGVYQFVNIRFDTHPGEGETAILDAYINLTPVERKSVMLDLRLVSKSNNFAGPGFNANFRNRNSFRGAELFILSLRSSYETIFSGLQRGLNSYELGVTGEIQIPRFLLPFFRVNPERPIRNIPRTRIALGYNLLNRVQFFWLNSFNASFGYLWSETLSKTHELNPIALNYVRLGNTTEHFENILERNPILRRSFEEQLIIGSNYTFTYNDQLREQRIHNFYFHGNVDVAGNLIYGINRIFREAPDPVDAPYGVMNRQFSQYSRLEADFRYYYRPTPRSRIATRLIAGGGFAYGNSSTLPYVKQFFIGGANSIRAFLPRSVGPGTYRTDAVQDTIIIFLDQIGDLKLEGNLEYRFPIIAIVKGAFFLDAGNIWTIRENPDTEGGQFDPSDFYNQLAVGTGTGIRIDASFFVLRFDLGIPIRKPWFPENQRWVINEIDWGDPLWRRENMVLNIAIGYPF